MNDEARERADERLERAMGAAGVRDPRPLYRPALRHLRERDRDAFQDALRHFEEVLVPAVADDADPLAAWLRYGRVLADALGPGRFVEVDAAGRARAAEPDPPGDGLLLYLPDDDAAPPLVLRCPLNATPPQDATVDLLVLGKQSSDLRP